MDTAVLIAGAGPTGLAAACGLAAAGVAVRVVDAAPAPATTSRALALQPRGIEVLDRLGALGDLPQRAQPISRLEVFIDGSAIASLRIDRALHRQHAPAVLVVSQAEIEAALRDRLAALGGAVEWNRPVTAVQAHPDAVTVRLGDDAVLRAGWLVGADGARSAVRKSAGIDFPGMPLIERFLLADVRADLDRPRDATAAWLRGTELVAAFPLPGDRLWRVMGTAPTDGPDEPTPDEIVEHLGARLAAEAGGVIRATEWTSMFRIQRRLAAAYRRGRVLLAGDAAHIHSPLGGQGMNTGLGDAENLAWKLALVVTGRAEPALLDSYAAERRPIAEAVLTSTSQVTMGALGRGWAARVLRDRVAVPLLNREWVQRLITAEASQLRVSYRHGPLGGRGWRRPRPGDRVPDRDFQRADGTPVRLHDAVGPGWALAGPEPLAMLAADRLGAVQHLAGGDEALLIRPDGHLGWRGRDADELRGWLDRTLGPAR